jgi:hypothetical protein
MLSNFQSGPNIETAHNKALQEKKKYILCSIIISCLQPNNGAG